VQEGKLARASFPPRWNDVWDVPVLVQERKLACASFLPWWNDVVRDALIKGARGSASRRKLSSTVE
jgi:hypothetical protein